MAIPCAADVERNLECLMQLRLRFFISNLEPLMGIAIVKGGF